MAWTDDTVPAIFVFDNPRTCSQLFHRFLAHHPQLDTTAAYQWATAAAIGGPERLQLRLRSSDESKARQHDQKLNSELGKLGLDLSTVTYQVAARQLTDRIIAAKKNSKILLAKEHVVAILKQDILLQLLRTGHVLKPPLNVTHIPDDIYSRIQKPIFLIRHPALIVPSYWRAQKNNFGNDINDEAVEMWTMQRSTRLLFDSLRDRGPIVIDARDIVYRSEAVGRKVCEIFELDPQGLNFKWDAMPEEEQRAHPLTPNFMKPIANSTGPMQLRPEEEPVCVDKEYPKWENEFGAGIAKSLAERVDADMADYVYLRQFRLRFS